MAYARKLGGDPKFLARDPRLFDCTADGGFRA